MDAPPRSQSLSSSSNNQPHGSRTARSNTSHPEDAGYLTRRGHSDGDILGSRQHDKSKQTDEPNRRDSILPIIPQAEGVFPSTIPSSDRPSSFQDRHLQVSVGGSLDHRRRSSRATQAHHVGIRAPTRVRNLSTDGHRYRGYEDPRRLHPASLDTRPLPSLPSPEGSDVNRRENLNLPKWQPDEEISNCPICGASFTFWHRKHHCRKCGRVVCATCSPHRITIPRQFIVHPPSNVEGPGQISPSTDVIDLTNDESQASADMDTAQRTELRSDLALGGGEEVRLCNPCVPDPNPLPYQLPSVHNHAPTITRYAGSSSGPPSGIALRRQSEQGSNSIAMHHSPHRDSDQRRSMPGNRYLDGVFPPVPSSSPRMSERSSSLSHRRTSTPNSTQMFYGSAPDQSHQRYLESMLHRHRAAFHHHGQHASLGQPATLSRAVLGPESSPASATFSRPRLQEEDECPICHGALPPKTTDGSEAAREEHIKACIDANFAPTTPASHPSLAWSSDARPAAQPSPGSNNQHATPVSLHSGRSNGFTQQRRRTTGMVVYSATEKDCAKADGSSEMECVICFEEFAVGDEMGRLECLCKFHSRCIRQWWEAKGPGVCPVHQEAT